MSFNKLFKPNVDELLDVLKYNHDQQKSLGLSWVKGTKFKKEAYKELVTMILEDDEYLCLINKNNSLVIVEIAEMHLGYPVAKINHLRATDGSGKAIMSLVVEWAKSKGCTAITLSTSTGCHNARVFRSLGLGEPVGFNFIKHLQ